MRCFRVILHSGWFGKCEVAVHAPNMDCAFWAALYTADPSDRKGYHESRIFTLPDDDAATGAWELGVNGCTVDYYNRRPHHGTNQLSA